MTISRGRGLVLGALAAVGAAAAPAALGDGLERGKTPTVKVEDDFFAPESVSIKVDDKVKYKWNDQNSNPHNVTLEKGPKGVKKKDFKSATGSIGIRFVPKFEKKGTYDFVCTIHPGTMTMKVTVKR